MPGITAQPSPAPQIPTVLAKKGSRWPGDRLQEEPPGISVLRQGLWQLSAALAGAPDPQKHPSSWSSHPVIPWVTTSKSPKLPTLVLQRQDTSAVAPPCCLRSAGMGFTTPLAAAVKPPGPSFVPEGRGRTQFPASRLRENGLAPPPQCQHGTAKWSKACNGPYWGRRQSHSGEGDREGDRAAWRG